MNVVMILTGQHCKHMVGAYGRPEFNTPNLDRLAARGLRLERAYRASPGCTPARASLMSRGRRGTRPTVVGGI